MKHLLPALCFFFILAGYETKAQFRIDGPETICAGTSATLSAVGCAGTLLWSTGATTTTITIMPTVATLYSATCTESGGNPKRANHPVGIFPKPPLTSNVLSLCADENVILSTNSTEFTHNDILWKRDGQPIVSGGGAYVANQMGTYTVEDGVTPGVWVPYPSAPAGVVYRAFSFWDDDNGWAITGRQDLVKTTDGGKSWVKPTYTLNLAPGDSLADVTFTDAATGWTCTGGKIFKTSDGGVNWVSQYADSIVLKDLFFLDNQRGWAVGSDDSYRSFIVRTNDGGFTWQRTNVGFIAINKIQFVSATTGWAGGSSYSDGLYRTTDGGITWQQRSANPYSFPVDVFYFQDANQGWVISNRNIYRTQDGGLTWTYPRLPLFEYIEAPVAIRIKDGIGWLLDWDSAYYTTDSGLTWRESFYGNGQEQFTAAFLPSGKILAASKTGSHVKFLPKAQPCLSSVTILPAPPAPKITPSTIEALCQGESITLTASGCAGALNWSTGGTAAAITVTPSATTSYTAFCAGANGCRSTAYAGVTVVPKATLDTNSAAPCFRPVLTVGNVWSGMDMRWTEDGQPIDYRDTKPYLAQSAGTYAAAVDAAGAWQPQAATRSSTYQMPNYPTDNLKDVQFVNDSTGFIVGSKHQFLRTTDGGKNWIASKLPVYGEIFGNYHLFFISPTQGWIIGSYNEMEVYDETLLTTDGGISWTKVRSGNPGSGSVLNDVVFVDSHTGWAVGRSGRIIKFSYGGLVRTSQTSNTSAYLRTVFFLDANRGWVGGENGTLLTTTNGGATWIPRTIANVSNFQSIHFFNASEGWAVSAYASNGLYRTHDGGLSWTWAPLSTDQTPPLKRVQFLNDSIGFVQSEKFIHATTDGGITWKKSYHHLNAAGMSFTDATHGWVVGGSIMTYVPAPPACTSAPVTVLPFAAVPLSTIASGSWNTPAVWSCGTIPTALDSVIIDAAHTVTLPGNYSAKAKSVELRGQIQYNTNAALQMGQN